MRQTACARRSRAGMISGGTRGREPHVRHDAAGFLALLGGASAAAWPAVVRAQKQEMPRLVGVLSGFSEIEIQAPLTAFRSELNRLGWLEGSNLILDAVTTVDYERMAAEAGRLVSRSPDVIV